ncbi:MAG: GTPase, partial [Candidatus Limnocylindria bacterium]
MQVTIVGLPGSGKTTVFNALTGGHAETGGFSGGRAAPNVSVVKVPDERVDRLTALFNPKKTTYADVTYVDVAIPAGAAREGSVNPDVL